MVQLPTGYASEAVKSVTIDGNQRKTCKLKLIPEEADIVRMIYDLYIETDSLTLTEAALLNRVSKRRIIIILPVFPSKRFYRIRFI